MQRQQQTFALSKLIDLIHVEELNEHHVITSKCAFVPLQEWSWTQARPGAQCWSARQCAVCSQAPSPSPPLCRAPLATVFSAPAAERSGRTATSALSTSPWCRPRHRTQTGQSVSRHPACSELQLCCWAEGWRFCACVCVYVRACANHLNFFNTLHVYDINWFSKSDKANIVATHVAEENQ